MMGGSTPKGNQGIIWRKKNLYLLSDKSKKERQAGRKAGRKEGMKVGINNSLHVCLLAYCLIKTSRSYDIIKKTIPEHRFHQLKSAIISPTLSQP